MNKYTELKLYLKSEDTKRDFKELIAHYGTGDKAVKAIIQSYKSGLILDSPKFI